MRLDFAALHESAAGTKRPSWLVSSMVAIRGKADLGMSRRASPGAFVQGRDCPAPFEESDIAAHTKPFSGSREAVPQRRPDIKTPRSNNGVRSCGNFSACFIVSIAGHGWLKSANSIL